MGAVAKVSVHFFALAVLGIVTTMVVHEGGVVLEESERDLLPAEAVEAALKLGAAKGEQVSESSDDLFDLLASPAAEIPTDLVGIAANIPTISNHQQGGRREMPQGGMECVERGPPVCRNVSATCVREGPSCSYEKTCVANSTKCFPVGICTQPSTKCHLTFSQACVDCAKNDPTCQHAHTVATECVPTCERNCMKDAQCEQKCAQGCLSKYSGFMDSCKKRCPPCQDGAKQVCWDACNEWKTCAHYDEQCTEVSECVKQGQVCTPVQSCTKNTTTCHTTKHCVEEEDVCEQETHCIKRDTECSHDPLPECTECRNSTAGTACVGEERVKAHCAEDCLVQCSTSKEEYTQSCLDSCNSGCHSSQEALGTLCKKQCPACSQNSKVCRLKCLQEETVQTCHKVCTKYGDVKECVPTCAQKKTENHCIDSCQQWQPHKNCQKSCKEWQFSEERPCDYPCTSHGFKHVCDPATPRCVQWTGGKVCDEEGPCLQYKTHAQQEEAAVLPLAPGPVLPDFDSNSSGTEGSQNVILSSTALQYPAPPNPDGIVTRVDNLVPNGMPPDTVLDPPPLLPSSKLGQVMQQATEDVEHFLSSQQDPQQSPGGAGSSPSSAGHMVDATDVAIDETNLGGVVMPTTLVPAYTTMTEILHQMKPAPAAKAASLNSRVGMHIAGDRSVDVKGLHVVKQGSQNFAKDSTKVNREVQWEEEASPPVANRQQSIESLPSPAWGY